MTDHRSYLRTEWLMENESNYVWRHPRRRSRRLPSGGSSPIGRHRFGRCTPGVGSARTHRQRFTRSCVDSDRICPSKTVMAKSRRVRLCSVVSHSREGRPPGSVPAWIDVILIDYGVFVRSCSTSGATIPNSETRPEIVFSVVLRTKPSSTGTHVPLSVLASNR